MSPLLLLALPACGRYWFDTTQLDLGEVTVEAGVLRLEGEHYRLDWDKTLELRGVVDVQGLGETQEWNQIQLTVEWSPAVDDRGVRAYGVSLWDLDDASADDPKLLNSSATLDAAQLDASAAGSTIQLAGVLTAPTDGSSEASFALGLMAEDVSGRPTDPTPLVGPASLLVTVNGLNHEGAQGEPAVTVTLE